MNPWFLLIVAILCEIAATSLLKMSDGFAKPAFGIASIAGYTLCFIVMAQTFRYLPIGIAYAIWSGIGIIGAAAIGWLFFNESLGPLQYGFIAMILVGAIGLQVTTEAG